MVPKYSSIRHVIISPYEIHFLCFLMEAYEGLATVSTLQPDLGLVQLNIAPGCEDEVLQILEAEKERLQLRSVQHGEDGTI